MKVEWSDQRCIVCLRERDTGEPGLETTKGHVIPEAIGGRLWSPFLCKDCNSKMGTVEEELLNDVSVVLMAKQLLPELPPKLGLNIHSRAEYFRDDEEHGRLYARPRRADGELELNVTDARTRRDEDVRGEVEKKLRAGGAADEEVEAKLADYDALPPGEDFEWAPGKKVPKPIDLSGQTFGRPTPSRSSRSSSRSASPTSPSPVVSARPSTSRGSTGRER